VGVGALADSLIAILPVLVLWVTAFVVLLGDALVWRKGPKTVNAVLSGAGVLIALIVAIRQSVQAVELSPFSGMLSADGLAQVGGIVVLAAALLSALMASTYLHARDLDHGEYYVLLLLSASGAMLMASASDLIMVFLGLEVLSFGLYVLAGFDRREARSEEASIKYFLLGAFASAFLLYGIALLYGASGSTSLGRLEVALRGAAGHGGLALAGIALVIVGLGFKAALVPFHQWTPDVYEGAPLSATAFMAGAAKIGAFVAMLRVFGALQPASGYWLTTLQLLAILTMVFGNLLAVMQTNIKRMLAYSSIAHAGYLLVAVAVQGATGTRAALPAAMFYLFAYTFMTLGAFAVLVYLTGAGRECDRIEDLRGLARRDAPSAYAMMFFMLSLGGVPPTMGFMGKWQIFMAALTGGQLALAIVMAVVSVIAAFYYLRVVWMMCFEEPEGRALEPARQRTGAAASVMLALAATAVFGIMPGWLGFLTDLVR
jgi:NADH-quinone oxidoreductase subunit N